MKAFTTHTGLVAPLDRANVDTDQLVPKQFLKRIERSGFGEFLFYNWRYDAEGTPRPDFVLNQPQYSGATVLVADRNFGSGSSREHAVWALQDFGFRVVIAPSFADIFYNNCFKNGLLPVALPDSVAKEILSRSLSGPYHLTVDLQACKVSDGAGLEAHFDLDPFRRYCLMNGLDDIGLTFLHLDKIAAFEARESAW